MAKILVTGGAGYIGSHTCVELLNAGHEVVVLDNLCNSAAESLNRVQQLTQKSLTFIQGDIRDAQLLDQVFQQHSIDAVIHFAGLKAVGESQQIPLAYFDNNITGSISLVDGGQHAKYLLPHLQSSFPQRKAHHPRFRQTARRPARHEGPTAHSLCLRTYRGIGKAQ